jgi:anthranilate/para-aminobenzoate synthase component II
MYVLYVGVKDINVFCTTIKARAVHTAGRAFNQLSPVAIVRSPGPKIPKASATVD